MAKKLSLLLAAFAVVAFAAPAFASAAPEVTINGLRAPVGTAITGTSTNFVIGTSIGNVRCAIVEFSAETTINNGSTVGVVGTSPFSTTKCSFKGGTPITIDDATLLSLHSSEAGKGTLGPTAEATLPELTCHYSGSAVPFTYTSGGNTLSITGSLKASPAACGAAVASGAFTITSPGGPVVLD
jgi:hypothetical protein